MQMPSSRKGAEVPVFLPRPRCLRDILEYHAGATPEAIALLGPGRRPLSYSQLWRQATKTVGQLNRLGLGRGDRVALVLPYGPEAAAAYLAVALSATAAPLNSNYRQREFEFYLADVRARAVILAADANSQARAAAQALGIRILELTPSEDGAAGEFDLHGGTPAACAAPGLAGAEDIALVLHTSGTTARPKLVALSHANVAAGACAQRDALQLTADDRCFNPLPLFHIHGLMVALAAPLAAGGSIVCTSGVQGQTFFAWLREFEPTWMSAAPTIYQTILQAAEGLGPDNLVHRLRFFRAGAAPLPSSVRERIEALFDIPVIEAYGMTEAASHIACNPLPPRKRKGGSAGLAAGPEVAIMDAAGNLLPRAATGEIVIRGANVIAAYENNAEADAETFTNGWFRTGDVGYVDADGFIFITGRVRELINRGGQKVAPREIDEVLLEHPAVAEAVAFALPDARQGQVVAAAVVLRPGHTATGKELIAFAAARLTDYKVPVRVEVVDELPKGPTGKLLRIGLAERLDLAAQMAPAPHARPACDAGRDPLQEELLLIWRDILRLEKIGIYDSFFQLGGESMQAAELMARIEKTFFRRLTPGDLYRAGTVAELAEVIAGEQELGPREYRIIQVRGGDSTYLPLFLVPPAGKSAFIFRNMIAQLPPQLPIYSCEVPTETIQFAHPQLQAVAAALAEQIKTIAPEEPYQLCGYSFGGTIAYELCLQLPTVGHQNVLLAMIDAPCRWHARPPRARQWLKRRLKWYSRDIRTLGVRKGAQFIFNDALGVSRKLARRIVGASHALGAQSLACSQSNALPRYSGDIVLLRAADQDAYGYNAPDEKQLGMGWECVTAGRVEVHVIPGNHFTMLQDPGARLMTALLGDRLRMGPAGEVPGQTELVGAGVDYQG